MKNYFVFATLSFTLVAATIELLMSSNAGFSTFSNYSWLLTGQILSLSHITLWLTQGLALAAAAFLFINPKSTLNDGLRFGLITGLLYILLILFNMMIQVDHSFYAFFENNLLPLVGLQLLGFAVSGWLFGLMFELFAPKFPQINGLWSMV